MALRWWYLRRAVPWLTVLACCAAGLAVAAALEQWPEAALVLLPVLLGCCVAAAAFSFDETAIAVVAVTPRGGIWRGATRLAAAGVPLLVWTLLVLAGPGGLPLDRPAWSLLGAGAVAITAGTAALAARHLASPGPALAPGVVLAVTSPVVLTGMLGWEPVYPVGEFPAGVLSFWVSLGLAGVLGCAAALWRDARV